jgi:hypothetical protein
MTDHPPPFFAQEDAPFGWSVFDRTQRFDGYPLDVLNVNVSEIGARAIAAVLNREATDD